MNTQMQDILGYREVIRQQNALSHETQPTLRQVRNLVALAKRCSKASGLEKTKREQLQNIATTWQKFLSTRTKRKP
jgi:hypothetical protein